MIEAARYWAQDLPVIVSPVTLKPRFNPYTTTTAPPSTVPQGDLPPQVDPRPMSLLGADWTIGSLKYLAESGASAVTYYETTGWLGVMETEVGSPLPDKFRSLVGGVYPLYHVFADVADFAGGNVIPTRWSDPLGVNGTALEQGNRIQVLLARANCKFIYGKNALHGSMKPYCQDLRKRVVAKAQAGKQTQAVIAATFGVSLSTVEKWLHRKRATGKLTPQLPPHGPKRILQAHASFLCAQVKQQPDITLTELCRGISSSLGITISPSTVCRELQRLQLPRKKVAPR